ncbi:MAG: alkaline phosphatase family protein [Pseudomonadota bacterium]
MKVRSLFLIGCAASVAAFACGSNDDSGAGGGGASGASGAHHNTAGAAGISGGTTAGTSSGASAGMSDIATGGTNSEPSAGMGGAELGGAPPEAGAPGEGGEGGAHPLSKPITSTKRVLLISVDGLHQVDLANWVAGHATSTLANLAGTGVTYTAAHTPTPSDSFPGLLALVTGGNPKTTGVYYDDSYDRTLYAPGSQCQGNPGTQVLFDESLEYDASKLFSGGINSANLPLAKDLNGNCKVVYPHDFVQVNTLFEVIRAAGGYTAWSDKHAAYDLVNGPSGTGVVDLYTPEINSDIVNGGTVNGINLAATKALCDGTNSLAVAKVSDFTTCIPAVQAYDDTKVQAIINQIDGKLSDGSAPAPVPTIFGMNFQAVSVGEKLPVGGYMDAAGTPSVNLAATIAHVDASLGKMVLELQAKALLNSTLIIVTSKHGQSPIDLAALHMETGGHGTADVQDPLEFVNQADANVDNSPSTYENPNSGSGYQTKGHLMADDVGLLWLQDQSAANISATVAKLHSNASAIHADALPTGTIFTSSITTGAELAALYGDPTSADAIAAARAPNALIQPNLGVIYSGSSKKIAEHGGGTTNDTGVALLVSLPGLGARTVSTSVGTTQVAPTILRALGLDPKLLQAVTKENTAELPSLF